MHAVRAMMGPAHMVHVGLQRASQKVDKLSLRIQSEPCSSVHTPYCYCAP